MAGYSGRPLTRKLGLKPNARLARGARPKDFRSGSAHCQRLAALPEGVTLGDALRGNTALDVIACFVSSLAELTRVLPPRF